MQQITKMLTDHGHEMEVSDGRVHVKDWYTLNGVPDFEWVDVTEWTVEDCKAWLGY